MFMKKVLIVVLSFALLSTACSTAWVSTLDSYWPPRRRR